MADQPHTHQGFNFNMTSITGLAEALAGLVVAILAFVKGTGSIPQPTGEVAGILAALHGIGHGLKTH